MDDVRPLLVGDLAIGVRSSREVRAVTVGDGALAWQARMPAPVLAVGSRSDRFLTVLEGGMVQALDLRTGTPLWDLSVSLPKGVQPAWSTTDADIWLTTPDAAWRIDPMQGVVLEHHTARPPEGQKAAELAVGRHLSCTTGRRGGIHCNPGDWTLATEVSALPPLVHAATVLLVTPSGRILALDPARR